MGSAPIRVEVNGQPATSELLLHQALVNYGHFTAMQVRRGRTRGLDLHLARLDAATRELFGACVDPLRIRDHIHHALADTRDASVRVNVFWPEADATPSVMVAVHPPADLPGTPQSLKSVLYQRPVPHIKHVGSFAQTYHRRRAQGQGFDEAVLTGPDGTVSEAAISNIAFSDGTTVTWPSAPCLAGITMQLLESRLADADLPTRRGPMRLGDLPSCSAAFVTNSLGIAPVGRVDNITLPVDPRLMKTITEIYESVPWDPI
jgi:branched-subunit amino acid aminotransferase/4-amino-4-deoxychorismate lyase